MAESLLQRARRWLRREWRRSWATWATRAESAAVVRLMAAAATAGVPAATMLDAWAEDSRGGQGTRLEKAARLLRQGATASEAVAAVPGLVQDDHAVALAFGERTGLMGPVVQTALAGDALLDPAPRRGLRMAIGYLAVVMLLVLLVTGFLATFINPGLVRILDEFDAIRPALFERWRRIVNALAPLLWVPVAITAVAVVIRWSPPLRRLVLRPFHRRRRMAAALDMLAVAVAAGLQPRAAAESLAACQVDPVLAARLAGIAASGPIGQQLATAGLVDQAEAAEIDAAGESGPLALHRIAAERRTRSSRRLAAASAAIVPAVVLALGLLVMLQAVALFSLLTEMIHALA